MLVYCLSMTSTAPLYKPVAPEKTARPNVLPGRTEFVAQMIGKTKRHGTPIRNVFVQHPKDADTRPSKLAEFGRASYLDAFLWLHTLASAKEPYVVTYPSVAWARSLNLDAGSGVADDDTATAVRQWSKITRKLRDLNLVSTKRTGRGVEYTLLDESGNGTAYSRPKDTKDGNWFTLPDVYWLEDHYLALSHPAKVMLLIALSSKEHFTLPLERTKEWYGISRSTAQRGFRELQNQGLLTYKQSWRLDPGNKRGWSEVRTYELLGPYAKDAITASMKNRRFAPTKPTFAEAIDQATEVEAQGDDPLDP